MLKQPYIMIFAVASCDQIVVYSTDSIQPVAVINNVHLDSINDLTWTTEVNSSSTTLIAASSDGFCSFFKLDLATLCMLKPCDSSIVPEDLRQFYEDQAKVSFEGSVRAIQAELDSKGAQSFQKVMFRSKKF